MAARTSLPSIEDSEIRTGKWTFEELEFLHALVEAFEKGSLILKEGVTLRSYLAFKLSCEPKRVSKKMEGADNYNGRKKYVARSLDSEEAKATRANLDRLEARFHQSVENLRRLELIDSEAKMASKKPPPTSLNHIGGSGATQIGLAAGGGVPLHIPSSVATLPTRQLEHDLNQTAAGLLSASTNRAYQDALLANLGRNYDFPSQTRTNSQLLQLLNLAATQRSTGADIWASGPLLPTPLQSQSRASQLAPAILDPLQTNATRLASLLTNAQSLHSTATTQDSLSLLTNQIRGQALSRNDILTDFLRTQDSRLAAIRTPSDGLSPGPPGRVAGVASVWEDRRRSAPATSVQSRQDDPDSAEPPFKRRK